jgi:hypothetical protein
MKANLFGAIAMFALAMAMSATPATAGGWGRFFRNDGGFYGGGGVFYGDNGYSRAMPAINARPSQHVFYLPEERAPGREIAP